MSDLHGPRRPARARSRDGPRARIPRPLRLAPRRRSPRR
jgi:hypothetical protein